MYHLAGPGPSLDPDAGRCKFLSVSKEYSVNSNVHFSDRQIVALRALGYPKGAVYSVPWHGLPPKFPLRRRFLCVVQRHLRTAH